MKRIMIISAALLFMGCEKLPSPIVAEEVFTPKHRIKNADTYTYCCDYWRDEIRGACYSINNHPCDDCFKLCEDYPLP